ncbi:NAD(P)H-dependent oxidoreductase [Streptomyces sp. CB01881]|uniref:NAD(P)H-dependent oxidoreductase n=1 Tax=Streptomyces sp. CB01881 TaxID=2078691 RepID=UPI003211CC82
MLQFPFHWYSAPPLLKQWLDEVLAHGFAYGSGAVLHGTSLRVATTVGGAADVYRPEGTNRFTVAELLAPFDATAHLTRMPYRPPFVVHDTRRLTDRDSPGTPTATGPSSRRADSPPLPPMPPYSSATRVF